MSDEVAKRFEESPPVATEGQGGRSVTLSITMHPNGQIEFSIPTNKVLAHGLLGAAQEQLAVLAFKTEIAKARALDRNGNGINGLLKRMGKGGN